MNPNESIRNIMTTMITRVSPTTKINDIHRIFLENEFHHLPVVEYGLKLVGIISRTDFEKFNLWLSQETTGKTWTQKSYNSLTAAQLMTKSPMVLDPDDSIGLAADIFLANKFHALPIIENDILVGMLTTHDLLKHFYASPIAPSADEVYQYVEE